MKNCCPPLSALPGMVTVATEPRVIFALRGSSFTAFNPPVPHCARFAGSFVSGSPPWMMPYLIILWKIVPLYPPAAAVFMKYAVVSGASSASRSITNVPTVVSTTACFGARRRGLQQPEEATQAIRASCRMWPSMIRDACQM